MITNQIYSSQDEAAAENVTPRACPKAQAPDTHKCSGSIAQCRTDDLKELTCETGVETTVNDAKNFEQKLQVLQKIANEQVTKIYANIRK